MMWATVTPLQRLKIGDPKIIFKSPANNKILPLGDVEDGESNIFGFSAFNPRRVLRGGGLSISNGIPT
jgi:hypothetical protein